MVFIDWNCCTERYTLFTLLINLSDYEIRDPGDAFRKTEYTRMQKFLFFMLIYLTVASTGFGRECVHENSMSAIRGCLRDLSNTELRNVYHNVFSKIESVEARAALQKSQLEFVEYRQHSCSVVAETTKHLG